MKRAIATAIAAIMLSAAAEAQSVNIHPQPQQIEWAHNTFTRPQGFKVRGAATADSDAVELLRKHFPSQKGPRLIIGERGDKAVEKVKNLIPDKRQGYYLKVTPEEVIVAGNDGDGTYYAIQTLLSLAQGAEMECVEITDWPTTQNRGVVEGFYGNAWSFDDRAAQFEFYGRHKLDTYIYGPKNDPYHRGKWRLPYPEADAEHIAQLVRMARKNKIRFVWGLHPALDHKWNEEDNRLAVEKLEQLYGLGVRNFAVFFDDVFGKAADGKKHAQTMDYIMKHFIASHPDIESLIICPSLYNKSWAPRFQESYLADIADIDPFIQIMWTGDNVVNMMHKSDIEWINPQIKRKAMVWHNYPVSDYAVDHLLMGPYSGNDTEVTDMVSGFTANPMEYAEASKVSLFGTADYLWNPQAFDADKSWEAAIKELAPANTEAFRKFCLYNIDPGQTAHRFRRDGESPVIRHLSDKYEASLAKGDTTGLKQFIDEFTTLESSCNELLAAADSSRLLTEIKPWIEATRLLAMRGQSVGDMYKALTSDSPAEFITNYLAYTELTDRAAAITSRSFKGTIKSARPVAGTRYAEPLLRRSVAQMIKQYRKDYTYRTDLFPELVLENGVYTIGANGKILGNPQAGTADAAPMLQSEIDDINPDRQLWRITYQPETKAYAITNAQDGQTLDNFGRFAEANPEQYVFEIRPVEGGYSLVTSWSGYPTFLGADDDNHISRRMKSAEQTVFTITAATQQ